MRVRLETIIKDPRTSRLLGLKRHREGFDAPEDEIFLDGPVCRHVAVLDFDPETGALSPPVPFFPPDGGRKIGRYEVHDPDDVHSVPMIKASVFGTVLKTMRMFEKDELLGRPLTWAFKGEQLLVVPRAGRWANAFYERESHSLQFFSFPSAVDPHRIIHTALSHDIVSHETGHAILDGIAPDLYDAQSPQALAIHEAVADITALMMAIESRVLRTAVLNEARGSIDSTSAFSGIAAEFAAERDPGGHPLFLRDLRNEKSLRAEAGANHVTSVEPHTLSEVLAGALYSVMRRMYNDVWLERSKYEADPVKVSGLSLFVASERFKRMVLRSLDYLPPGEVSFADYGRAIIASDQASYPDPSDANEREDFKKEFVARGIVKSPGELSVKTNFASDALRNVDLRSLVSSDWVAYEFANRNRELLQIPEGIPFHVRPRLDVSKVYFVGDAENAPAPSGKQYRKVAVRECILKVNWNVREPSGLGAGFPASRSIKVGTTLAIDWESRTIRALLTSDRSGGQSRDRDRFLRQLVAGGYLKFDGAALGPDGTPLPSSIRAEVIDGVMSVKGTARMLHVACCHQMELNHEP